MAGHKHTLPNPIALDPSYDDAPGLAAELDLQISSLGCAYHDDPAVTFIAETQAQRTPSSHNEADVVVTGERQVVPVAVPSRQGSSNGALSGRPGAAAFAHTAFAPASRDILAQLMAEHCRATIDRALMGPRPRESLARIMATMVRAAMLEATRALFIACGLHALAHTQHICHTACGTRRRTCAPMAAHAWCRRVRGQGWGPPRHQHRFPFPCC